jgi:hypothetical protein
MKIETNPRKIAVRMSLLSCSRIVPQDRFLPSRKRIIVSCEPFEERPVADVNVLFDGAQG